MKTLYSLAALCIAAAPLTAQSSRDQVRVDDPLAANTPDGFDISLQSDGDMVVAMWNDERDPVNTFDDEVFVAVSMDGGLSFGAEHQVTNLAVSAVDVDDARMAVSGGVIHIVFDDDSISSGDPVVKHYRSTDMGLTWTSTSLFTDGQNPEVSASGVEVTVVWYDNTATPHALMAAYSNDSGATFGAPVVVDAAAGDADTDGYQLRMSGSTAHLLWFDDRGGNNDCFYSQSVAGGAWSAGLRLDQDPTGTGDVDSFLRLAADGSTVVAAWYEDGRTVSTIDEVFCAVSSDGGLTWGNEIAISNPAYDVDYLAMGAAGQNAVIAWSDDRNAGNNLFVRSSNDGGATWGAENAIAGMGLGGDFVKHTNAFVNGDMMFLVFHDDSGSVSGFDELPMFCWSNDAGATWSPMALFGSGYELDEDIDTENNAACMSGNNLLSFFQTDGGAVNPDAVLVSGIRAPFLDIALGAGTVTWTLTGLETGLAGEGARIGASLTTSYAASTHPENPALTLDLGSDAYLAYTTANRQSLGSLIAADGSAGKTLAIPAAVAGQTLYFQGWGVILPPTAEGLPASDVVSVTFP